METLERNEWADVAQLVEITSDAVIICELDGTILHVNNRLLDLTSSTVMSKTFCTRLPLSARPNIVCRLRPMAPRAS